MSTHLPDLEPLRDLVARHAPSEGFNGTLALGLGFHRSSHPTTFCSAPAFGVTLGVVMQGVNRLRLEGHEMTIDPSHCVVITRESEVEMAAQKATPDKPYLGCCLCFAPDRVARALLALTEAGAESAAETVPAFALSVDRWLVDALERLFRTLDDPLEQKLFGPLITEEILLRLLRSDAAAAVRSGVRRAPDADRILQAMQFIREHAAERLSVREIARQVAMSPSHFAHRFRAVARVSPMRYQRDVRLDQARELMMSGALRAGEVARRIGFESAAHFTREFKRRYGTPPSHYVRRFAIV
jgi:AraC-like DNA-binding protein